MRFEIAVLKGDDFNYYVGILDTKRDLFANICDTADVNGDIATHELLVSARDKVERDRSGREEFVWERVTADDDIFVVARSYQYVGDEPIILKTIEGKMVSARPSEVRKALEALDEGL